MGNPGNDACLSLVEFNKERYGQYSYLSCFNCTFVL